MHDRNLTKGLKMMRVKNSNREAPSRKQNNIYLLLLFLACLDFAGVGSGLLALLLFLYTAMHIRQMKISGQAFVLFLFSLSYFVVCWYHYGSDLTDLLKYFFFPWMAYMFGTAFTRNYESRSPLLVLIFTISAGLFLRGTLNTFSYRFFHRVDERHARLAYDFWQQAYVSVTGQGLLFLIPAATSIGMLFSKKKKWVVAACFMLATSIYYSLLQAHRTLFSIIMIMMVGALLYLLISAKIATKKKLEIVAAAAVLLLLCVIVWNFDIAGARSLCTSTRIYRRLANGDIQSAGGRVHIWKSFFDSWLQYPFGGKKIELYRNHGYVHNFWLDIYRVAGILPFVLSIIVTVNELVIRRRYERIGGDTYTLIIVKCVSIAILLGFMVEPVYIANPYVFYYHLVIQGGILGTICREEMGAEQ